MQIEEEEKCKHREEFCKGLKERVKPDYSKHSATDPLKPSSSPQMHLLHHPCHLLKLFWSFTSVSLSCNKKHSECCCQCPSSRKAVALRVLILYSLALEAHLGLFAKVKITIKDTHFLIDLRYQSSHHSTTKDKTEGFQQHFRKCQE